MDHGIGVVSGATTGFPPMSCARRRTINHHRMTQDDTKGEEATPALSTSGGDLRRLRRSFSSLLESPRLRRQVPGALGMHEILT